MMHDDGNAGPPDDASDVGTVGPGNDVGSEPLARALAAQDVAAIGRALRHDVVVVPLMTTPEGETLNRVFEAPEGSARPYEVCLFSSTATLAAFLSDAPQRRFAVQRGAALVPFLEQHAGVIERVVFDPAGPRPMTATPQDVLLVLAPQTGDDDVAWVTRGGADRGTPGSGKRRPWWRRRSQG